ncbi:GPR endopeptidase [Fuchsiella alkaliacetigena]|uniref:GPR endopeptidase n=1 Tax=Fuchsiella alkaliacetigena TaxID=957042 RepID=UPI00200A5615|nr:GPR endopeptidase [Fuchsiella alkaliacetigena]MCK8825142.1 GPR endopeptidase [Fuchsiella alkaliacetigena]
MNNLDSGVYTDLAVESHNLALERTSQEVQGVNLEEEQLDGAHISRVEVLNQQAAQVIGKKPGNYITIEAEELRAGDRELHEYLSGVLARELAQLIDYNSLGQAINQEPTILVIGLGNWNATPDALGPQVVHHLLVTRHLYDSSPQEAREGMRPVCALSPGVLGLTGIETAEILKGVIDRVNPDLVIAVDSLVSRDTKHLASTIQISNTGIYPGSGLGKQRIGITEEDMGVPVVAIGVPTVINSITIVSDTIDLLAKDENLNNTNLQQALQEQKKEVVDSILEPYLGDLIVSPKAIDQLIKNVSRVIAGGLNVNLHPDIRIEDVGLYLQ